MTSLYIQLRISLLIVVGLSHNLVRVVWVVHDTLWSYKILCDIEGHVDLLGPLHGKWLFSLLFDLSIHNSSILDQITSGCKYDTSSIFFNWDISVINCQIELKSVLTTCICILTWYMSYDKIGLKQNVGNLPV